MPSVPKCGRIYTHKFTPDFCPLAHPAARRHQPCVLTWLLALAA